MMKEIGIPRENHQPARYFCIGINPLRTKISKCEISTL